MLVQKGYIENDLLKIVYILINNFHPMNLMVLTNVIFSQILIVFSNEIGYSILTSLIYISKDPNVQRLIVKHIVQNLNSLILTKLGSSIIIAALQNFNPFIAGEIFNGLSNISNLCSGKYSHSVILVLIEKFFNHARVIFEKAFDDTDKLTQIMKSHYSLKIIIRFWSRLSPIEKLHLLNKLELVYETNLKNTQKKAWRKTMNRMKEEAKNINSKFVYNKDFKDFDYLSYQEGSLRLINEHSSINPELNKGESKQIEKQKLFHRNQLNYSNANHQIKFSYKPDSENMNNINNYTTLLINYQSGHMDFGHKIHPGTSEMNSHNSRSIIKE